MRSFLRKIRQEVVQNQAYTRYFKYAFGEIILVVIGILIALQINNWNETRKQQIIIDNYLNKMVSEIKSVNELIEYNTTYSETLNKDLMYCINYMENKRVDSTDVFVSKLKNLTDCDSQTLFFPVINEFISKGYMSDINNSKIKEHLDSFIYEQDQAKVNDFDKNIFCSNQLQPFIQKNINYSDLMMFGKANKYFNLPDITTTSGPKTDFNKLKSNLELWNLIYRKIEIERSTIVINKGFLSILKRLDKEIKKMIKEDKLIVSDSLK